MSTDDPKAPTNKAVLFVDVLGFAELTESNALDVRMLRLRSHFSRLSIDDILSNRNPLTETFVHLHQGLQWAIQIANMKHPVTAITFSDSAFIATEHLYQAAAFGADFARSMIWQKVPVRMGIAWGSFAAVKFRSDVSADEGDHAAQFLGAGVVRSYRAEKCGIKGIRILLHPSAEPLLAPVERGAESSTPSIPLRPVADTERENRAGVRLEVDYWDLPIGEERRAWQGLQDMWAVAPEKEHTHYQATAGAIDRMRIARGQEPLGNLRRRTVPRRAKSTK